MSLEVNAISTFYKFYWLIFGNGNIKFWLLIIVAQLKWLPRKAGNCESSLGKDF